MTDRATSSSRACAPPRLSPTRTRATWKPRVDEADVALYRCPRCESLLMGLGSAAAQVETDLWRSAIMRAPYGEASGGAHARCPRCGGSPVQPMAFRSACAADEGFSFAFTGGIDANRLTLSWEDAENGPALVVLKTFTGLQTRPRPRGGAATFPLADEDAYCYCDLDPCEQCVARCKRGFKLYVVRADGEALRFACT